MCVASFWDDDIRSDMNAIGWNPFNSNANDVINSNKVSFYKGVPVYIKNSGRPWFFYAISLNKIMVLMNLSMSEGIIGKR